MTRVKRGVAAHARHKKVMKMAKGYQGRANSCFTVAIEKVEKALRYAYRDRRKKKIDFRKLWIQRINAAAREQGLVYSRFMHGLKQLNIELNRKMLSEIAIAQPDYFKQLAELVKSASITQVE